MWNLSHNNQWITSFNSCQIIIGSRTPQQQPLLTIQRFSTPNSYIIKDEEEYKSFEQLPGIFKYFQEKKLNRNSFIDICGGGLTLDIGGFAASAYMRGIKCNYFPTTLLSMVDASVGGKTGINFEGKNTIGFIKQPQGVYMNVNTLKSLNKRELINGMAQVIKMAFVYDKQFFKWLQQLDKNKLLQYDNITHIIKQSIRLKIQVVKKDVNQKHQRKWLNFGHTIGHAIQYMKEPQLKHGQCVSIGMVLANKIASELGILQNHHSSMQLKELLQKFQLPTKLPSNFNSSRCIDLLLKDKKQSTSQNINFVLVKDIGQPCQQTTQISPQLIRKLILNEPMEISSKIQSNNLPLNQNMFPSSKSLSIRYLYASALKVLSDSKSFTINNCLHSDDTAAMISCLKKLGFQIIINNDQIVIKSFNLQQKAVLNVGNSGLTARFILPLCTILGGKYQIQCDNRMQQRPNQQLFRLLQSFGANIKYLKQNKSFPVKIIPSQINIPKRVFINGLQSSQFISSILFLSIIKKMPIIQAINPKNDQLVSQSFIRMTISVLKSFKIIINYESNTFSHELQQDCSTNHLHQFTIEPDYAGLSYPYLHRLLNSNSLPIVNYQQSLQGDSLFYKYIQQLQSTDSNYLQLNFNNCTDTFMTMLIYIVCKKKNQFKLKITHITNQRDKQSNRISALIQNLSKIADIQQNQDGITIRGGIDQYKIKQCKQIIFQSYDDHRIGMSLTVLSAHLSKLFPSTKFIITKPDCVNKTFPNFWKWMESQNYNTHPYSSKQLNILKQKLPQSYYLIGMRGCGKTTYAQSLSSDLNLKLIEMDKICTQNINSQFKCQSISELVQKYGWNKFRQVQTGVLKKIVKQKNVVVATGGGIVQTELNRNILKRQQCIYIEKRFEDLLFQESLTRPSLNQDLRKVFNKRQKLYEQLAKTIITLNQSDVKTNTDLFLKQFKRKYHSSNKLNGFVLCVGNFQESIQKQQYDWIQWRIDQLLKQHSLKDIRFKLAQYYYNNQLPTILTLRTKEQFGDCDKNQYQMINKQIKKIPTQYIDLQIIHNSQNQSHINPLWSYHGSQRRWLQQMKLRKGMKKVILTPQRNYKHYQNKYYNDFDLFWTMGLQHRTTRLNSKTKMVTSKQIDNNLYGIMTKKQFNQLFNLVKKVIK